MRTWALVWLLAASAASAAVFERFLDPNQPRDRAIAAYVELEKAGKAQSNDLAELAVLLVEKGFPQDGERYLRKALKLDKRNVEARYRLGLILQRLGKDREAARQYRRVIASRPGFAEAQFMLGLALERCGRRWAAVRAYAKAYKHNPQLADPAKNPLVLDSKLQTQALLARYRREVAGSTLPLSPLDPAAVRRMMLAKPASEKPAPEPPPSAAPPVPSRPNAQPGKQSKAPDLPRAPSSGDRDGKPKVVRAGQQPLPVLPNVSRPLRLRR